MRRPASDLGGVRIRPGPVSSWAWRTTATVPWSRIDVPALETKQFSASHAGEAAEEHEASEPGLDRFGELENRRRVEHRAFWACSMPAPRMVHGLRPISPSARAVFKMARNTR